MEIPYSRLASTDDVKSKLSPFNALLAIAPQNRSDTFCVDIFFLIVFQPNAHMGK
jgi:hypothetical protein